jgi:hypothetical protein
VSQILKTNSVNAHKKTTSVPDILPEVVFVFEDGELVYENKVVWFLNDQVLTREIRPSQYTKGQKRNATLKYHIMLRKVPALVLGQCGSIHSPQLHSQISLVEVVPRIFYTEGRVFK